MTARHYDRRTVLGVGGAGVVGLGLLTLAGCSASASTNNAGAGTASKATTLGASPSGSGSAAGGGTSLGALSAVPVGGSATATAKVGGDPVVVSQQTAGAVTAFSAICTHMGCTVNPAGAEFHCPCHGSRYDAFTGAVLHGPAPAPLAAIPVQVVGGQIVTS